MVVGDRAGSDVALHLNEAGQLLLALMEATEREQSETMAGGFGLPQHALQPTPGTYSGPICSSTVPLGGKGADAGRVEEEHWMDTASIRI